VPGFSAADRAVLRAELGVAPGAVVVIQVSRMEEWKGHRLHLSALARLTGVRYGSRGASDSESKWTCWIVGGAQRPQEARYLEDLRA
jgi:hypothetical protein